MKALAKTDIFKKLDSQVKFTLNPKPQTLNPKP